MDFKIVIFRASLADDPLQYLIQTFGNASLEKWLEIGFGDALCKDLTRLDSALYDVDRFILDDLGIVSAIIPPVPNFMDDEFDTTWFGGYLIHSDLNQVAKLIKQIIKTVISNCKGLLGMFLPSLLGEPLASKVLLKTVYYANENDINNDISDELIDICSYLLPCCDVSSHTAMALITILGKKMPDAWFQNFLKPQILLRLRMTVTLSKEKMCPYVDSLRNLYSEMNLEEKFEIKVPRYKALLETSHMFQGDCLVMDLKCISQIIGDNDICINQFIMSGLLHKFHMLLCEPSKIGDQTFVIKSFLTVFVSFETNTESHYEWKSDLFKKLVVLVRDTVEFLLLTNETRYSYREVHTDSPLTTIERFENEAILAGQLLESLFVLNSIWHQWFDIVEDNKIIDAGLFKNPDKIYDIHDKLNHSLWFKESKNFPWLVNFIKICPAIVSVKGRLKIFAKVNSKKENSSNGRKCFEVRRSDVLSDIFHIFSQNDSCTDDRWEFAFKGEIEQGPDVTREVYTILSQELQRRATGLWQGQPNKRSGNEVKCNYLGDALVPNISKENPSFKLLGKIMAKAILDKQSLDIPLSSEFFQRLRTTHVKHYSHLRREYFYLPQTFPALESLYKQLLPVKRKIELIRSDKDLTQHEKQEIIGNLTFDHGRSFDGLCLNFTVPGTDFELVEGGRDITLSPYNIDSYLEKLCAFRAQFDPVDQFKAIREGFDEVLSSGSVDLLLPEELKVLCCGGEFRGLIQKDLQSHCVCDRLLCY